MVWLTNAKIHKIDSLIFKPFNIVQKEDKLKETCSSFKTRFLQLYLWQKKELTQMSYPTAEVLSISINISSKA